MDVSKLLSLMGIARKAGKIKFGYDTVIDSVQKKQAKLIIMASDLSPRSARKIEELAKSNNVEILNISISMDEIYSSIGKKTGIVCINDEGFAEKMIDISKTYEIGDNKQI